VITTINPPLELDAPCVEPIVLLSQLFQSYLDIPVERAYLYNQKWKIPDGPQMFQVISIISDQPYGTTLSYANNPVTGNLEENCSPNCRSIFQYEIWSRSSEARLKRFLALTALHSTQCQQLCEKYGFAVAQIPLSFADLSYLDGAARMNRYAITFAVLTATAFSRPVEWFVPSSKTEPALIVNP
jgi:hypothetical protein